MKLLRLSWSAASASQTAEGKRCNASANKMRSCGSCRKCSRYVLQHWPVAASLAKRCQRLAPLVTLVYTQQAYANKELSRQKEEADATRKEELQQNAAMEAAMEKERVRLLDEQQRKEREAAERKRADAAVVKDQIRFREMQRFVEGEEEAARERAQVDAVVQAVQAEEERAAAARRSKQTETRHFIDEFKHQREAHLQSQREAERDAERAERAHLEAQAAHRDKVAAAKNADLATKQAAYQKIVEEQEAVRRAQDEEDKLRWVIVEEEAQKKSRDEAAKREAAAVRGRREMREAVEAQKRLQEQQRAEEAAREAELVRQFLDRVAADEAAAAEAKRRQHEAAKKFQAGIEEQKGQRMHAYAQQRAAEDRATAEAAAREEYRLKVVQEARRRLLEEHAAALEGYLPKGVFKSEEDLEVVRRARGQQ